MAETKAGAARRNAILGAALDCFLDRGYAATSIDDIRQASGASTGSIYHFFPGKPAIAEALLQRAVAGWAGADPVASDGDASFESATRASVRGLVLWGSANPGLFRFMDEIRTLAARDPAFAGIRDALAAGRSAAAARYAAAASAGLVRPLPWPVAHALLLGPAYDYLREAPPADGAEATADILADAAWEAVSVRGVKST
ncbi:MAG TPA: TetR/AcrR family transcriptional regulator [Devosiaceae bacterium]|jgi:AcrR family transcriptional regulator|nr:TetR/AcrR family transcriptional regulator [Devosiaceae bacterium]